MGYSTRPGTSITDFTPDDTDTVMYLESSAGITLDKTNRECKYNN